MSKNNESGRTMVEVLATLSILGMLAITILAAINATYDKYKLSKITQQLVDLQKNINSRFAADGNYSNISIKDLIKDNVVPPDMVTGPDALHHTYKKNVMVESANVGGYNGKDKAFKITFEDLPYHVCTELLSLNWQMNNYSELVSIDVDGIEYKWVDGKAVQTGSQFSLPMDLNRATKACKSGGVTTVKWTFF